MMTSRGIKLGGQMLPTGSESPYRVPRGLDSHILETANQLKENARQERRRKRTLKVHEKELNPRDSIRKTIASIQEVKDQPILTDDYTDILMYKDEEQNDIKSTKEFIKMISEIRRLEFFIAAGREKIQSLEDCICVREKEMAQEEYRYTENPYTEYVDKETNKTSLSVKMVKEESAEMLRTVEEIQRITRKIETTKREIIQYEEMLKYDQLYKDFLWKLSPPEWQKQQETRRQIAEKIKAAAKEKEEEMKGRRQSYVPGLRRESYVPGLRRESYVPGLRRESYVPGLRRESGVPGLRRESGVPGLRRESGCPGLRRQSGVPVFPPIHHNPNSKLFSNEPYKPEETLQEIEKFVGNLEDYEKPQIYFTHSSQLLNILTKMKEDISSLSEEIYNKTQSLEKYREKGLSSDKDMEKEIERITTKMNGLNQAITEGKAKLENLKEETRIVCENEDIIDKQAAILNQKLQEIHSTCIEPPMLNMPSIYLAEEIQSYMFDLLDKFNNIPKENLRLIMMAYRREKAAREKEKEMEMKAMALEEKRRRREQLTSQVKKPTGKKMMWRSFLEKKQKSPRDAQKKRALMEEEGEEEEEENGF